MIFNPIYNKPVHSSTHGNWKQKNKANIYIAEIAEIDEIDAGLRYMICTGNKYTCSCNYL